LDIVSKAIYRLSICGNVYCAGKLSKPLLPSCLCGPLKAQEYLGHNSVETSMIYTHVMRGLASTAVSPLGSFSDQVGKKD
jgi:hypothetical protein